MSVNPPLREVFRQSWPKRDPRRAKPKPSVMIETIAAIRCGEMTVAEGSRAAGCSADNLARRVWEETKADVLARDIRCALCPAVDCLDVQHRHARKAGGTSNPRIAFGMDNLITLCRTHHSETELNPDWARDLGLRVDTGEDPATARVQRHGQWVLLAADGGVKPIGGAAS